MAIDQLRERRLRLCAHDSLLYFSILEQQQRGNAAYIVGSCRLRTVVHIQLDYLELAFVFGGQQLDHWRNHPAGTTPLRPEIHQDRRVSF